MRFLRNVKCVAISLLNKIISGLHKLWMYFSYILSFIFKYIILITSVTSFVVAIITFYLQFKGNKTAEKISTTQDRIEFFQVKNHLVNKIKENKVFSDKSTIKIIEGIDVIFENKYTYIVHKDKTGVFPKTDPKIYIEKYFYKRDLLNKHIDIWLNHLKKNIIKVRLLKQSQKKYALPMVREDFFRLFKVATSVIQKGFIDDEYFWKNKRINHVPFFIIRIEPKTQDKKDHIIKISDNQKDYYLNTASYYEITFSQKKNSWVIFDKSDIEIKFAPFNYVDGIFHRK
ncbi:MAG: hypothetical protein OXN83_01235 [Oligoflexia bacterium]|nr:hypothetical protein [Oligoflexia bacterium]